MTCQDECRFDSPPPVLANPNSPAAIAAWTSELSAWILARVMAADGSGSPGSQLAWRKVTYTYADFATAGTDKTLDVTELGNNTYRLIFGWLLKHTQSFGGGAINTYTIKAGSWDADAPAAEIVSLDVFQGVAVDKLVTAETEDAWWNPFYVQLKAHSGGANLDAATTGSVDLWLYCMEMDYS